MAKNTSRTLIVVLLVLAIGATAAWWILHRPAPQPNVVVFMLDTLRKDGLGCYGRPAGPTPAIDALAADGVRFDQAMAASGWTVPSVASLLTGTWPTLHGAMGKGTDITPIRPELSTAADVFGRAGYDTVGFGNAAFVSPMIGVDRGFDLFDHRYSYNWDTRRADETIDAVLAQLRQRKSRSSFYFIHLFDAHLDYNPPEEYATRHVGTRRNPPLPVDQQDVLDMGTGADGYGPPSLEDRQYLRGLYDAEIDFMDDQIGRFIEALKSLGLYDDTTIVIVSDHGEEFWEHGGFQHGHSLYDELVHIPLVIKLPAAMDLAGRSVAAQVRLIDVMPTMFDVAGIDAPDSFAGRSLLPWAKGSASDDLPAYFESTLYGPPLIARRGPRYKFIQELTRTGVGASVMFDWRQDPGETRDLSIEAREARDDEQSKLLKFHSNNLERARNMSTNEPLSLHPDRIKQLRSLGYL
jgi:arylsulfatase A-like enzyme